MSFSSSSRRLYGKPECNIEDLCIPDEFEVQKKMSSSSSSSSSSSRQHLVSESSSSSIQSTDKAVTSIEDLWEKVESPLPAKEQDESENVPDELLTLPPGVHLKPRKEPKQGKARHIADPNDPNPKKRPRKSYSDADKQRVIEADARGGRREYLYVANILGMPSRTADNLIAKARKDESFAHDKRHDKASQVGHYTKKEAWHLNYLQELNHTNACLTLRQYLDYLNREIARKIFIEHNVPLSEEEKTVNKGLDMNKYLNDDSLANIASIRNEWKKHEIKSLQTIKNYLDGLIITKKHVVPEKATMNNETTMAKRLAYAKQIKAALESDNYFFVFMDEMPFYMDCRRNFGRAPKGRRAVVKVPASGHFTYKTQVALAVHPALGLIYGKYYAPKRVAQTGTKKSGKQRKPVLKTCWTKDEFKDYMDGLLEKLYNIRDRINDKTVIIVSDGAKEHGPEKDLPNLLRELPHFEQLHAFLKERGGKIKLIRAPPNSPQLNLCEYYNRTLRTNANSMRHELEYEKLMLEDFEHGKRMEGRLSVLESIIKACIEKMEKAEPQTNSVHRLMLFFDKVIAENGYLDMSEPM